MEGVDALSRRLALLRACWGAGTPRMTPRTIISLAEGLPGARRLRLDLSGLPRRTALSSAMGRVLLNVLMLAAECLPRGGVISAAGQEDGRILVSISGTHAGWPREFSRLLNRPEAAWAALSRPESLLPPFVVLIAAHSGVRAVVPYASALCSSGYLRALPHPGLTGLRIYLLFVTAEQDAVAPRGRPVRMDDLLADFLTETNENLADLDVALVRLEQIPAGQGDVVLGVPAGCTR